MFNSSTSAGMFFHYVITVYVTSVKQARPTYGKSINCTEVFESLCHLEWEEYLKTFTAYTP